MLGCHHLNSSLRSSSDAVAKTTPLNLFCFAASEYLEKSVSTVVNFGGSRGGGLSEARLQCVRKRMGKREGGGGGGYKKSDVCGG